MVARQPKQTEGTTRNWSTQAQTEKVPETSDRVFLTAPEGD